MGRILAAFGAAVIAVFTPSGAYAQDAWPSKPVRLIVPFPPAEIARAAADGPRVGAQRRLGPPRFAGPRLEGSDRKGEPAGNSPREFATQIRREVERHKRVAEEDNIRIG